MKKNKEFTRNITPPYGPVTRLRYVFDLLSTHTFSPITSSLLKSRGFSGSDAFQTVSALKFLGVIDEEGNKTNKMLAIQLKGSEHQNALKEIVQTAYKKLFDTVPEPYRLGRDELHNDFITVYGISGRLASSAVPNFLWLCKEAGLEVLEPLELKERKPRIKSSIPNLKAAKRSDLHGVSHSETLSSTDVSVEVGEFRLVLPSDWDINKTRQAIVKGDFKVIYDELTELSTKLKKDEKNEAGGSVRVASTSAPQVDRDSSS